MRMAARSLVPCRPQRCAGHTACAQTQGWPPPETTTWHSGNPCCADGKGGEAAHWFDRLGFPCPFGVNIADWILDLASGEVAGKHP